MPQQLILIESEASGLRAALVADRRMQAIEIDRTNKPSFVGATTPAKVVRTVTGLGTTVKLIDGTEMLLDRGGDKSPLASGADIVVQVIRPPRGDKAGIASRSLILTGRALVHLPLEAGIKVSRRLDVAANQRVALEAALSGFPGGWIVRRTAAALSVEDVQIEAQALALDGTQAAAGKSKAPDAFRRLIGDYGASGKLAIQVAGLAAKATVERWCAAFAPGLSAKIEPQPSGLFDRYDLDDAVAALVERQVPLPGGASLVVEVTEALTAIDVNAGPQANAISVNLDAAVEVARQLRLRHIGGIVVIDFISMPRRQDQARIGEALTAALADDPSQTYVLPMSALGLVEMTRERRGPGLELE
jgi:ribonuclease E/ribonuclease G